jgi:hypothetical protein
MQLNAYVEAVEVPPVHPMYWRHFVLAWIFGAARGSAGLDFLFIPVTAIG